MCAAKTNLPPISSLGLKEYTTIQEDPNIRSLNIIDL